MHLQEITDEMAAKLQASAQKDAQGQAPPPSANGPGQTIAAGPGLSPGRAMTKNMTVDEVVADLKKSPFFMTELEENDDIEALKALAYEGSPFEVASGFKGRGNECFKARGWVDAKEFYTKGILVLMGEERKRAAVTRGEEAAETAADETTPQEVEEQRQVLESLYVNRAACHLELKNYRSCWLDGAAALRINPRNVKAFYRCAKAFLAVDRIEEADDACARGLELDPENAALKTVAGDIIKRNEVVAAKKRKEEERLTRERRRDLLLKTALKARNITMRSTEKPPDMEDAKVQLVPDPDDPRSSISFPTVLLYPADLESDFIKAFNEQETVSDHLGYVFPLPWDPKGDYSMTNVECYMDTVSGGLIKVGKNVPLLKVLSSDKVEVIDQVVRIFVVPKSKAESWAQEYKRQRALRRGH